MHRDMRFGFDELKNDFLKMHCARTSESTEREREKERERDHQGAPSATITNYSMVDL